jgi:hypothetical protein
MTPDTWIKKDTPMSPNARTDQPRSHTFLLTLWREQEDGPWRAALRLADGGVRLGFADMEQLMEFLLGLTDHPHMTNRPRHHTKARI